MEKKNNTTMDKIQEQELLEFYKIDDETAEKVARTIFAKYTHDKQTSNRPFAVIVLGQPGAGKSGLMTYTSNQFPSAVALDIDDLREYYPRYDEVKVNHPSIYERVTGSFATQMVIQYLTPWLIANKYDLVLHKTRADEKIISDTLEPLQEDGYETVMRIIAVHELESKMSTLERSLEQRRRLGYCRWVETPYHNAQYNGIVDLATQLEQGGVDAIEVYVRGEVPVEPRLVYSKVLNENIYTNPHMVTADGEPVIVDYKTEDYPSVKDAIKSARDQDVEKILETIPGRMEYVGCLTTPDDKANEFIGEIKTLQQLYSSKNTYTD